MKAKTDDHMGCYPEDKLVTLIGMALHMTTILSLSRLLDTLLRHFGQPRIVSQALAGLILGPFVLSRHPAIKHFVFSTDIAGYVKLVSYMTRLLFMFVMGLELDTRNMWKTKQVAATISYGGILGSFFLALIFAPLVVYHGHNLEYPKRVFVIVFIHFSATTTPVLIRLCAELKLITSEIGRLAIASALINDLNCLLLISLLVSKSIALSNVSFAYHVAALVAYILLLFVLIFIFRVMISRLNRRNEDYKSLNSTEIILVFLYLVLVSSLSEFAGFQPMISCFFLGLYFPREGKAARSLTQQLVGPLHNLFLPIYFGYTALQTDLISLKNSPMLHMMFAMVMFGILCKVVGTALAASYLNMGLVEGITLGLLLHIKGHVNFMLIETANTPVEGNWDARVTAMLLVASLLSTVIISPLVSAIVKYQRKSLKFGQGGGLEWADPAGDLRILACVYEARHLSTMLNLIEVSRGNDQAPLSVTIMHLIELTDKSLTNLLFHQLTEAELANDGQRASGDARHIGSAVDTFIQETGLRVNLLTGCSSYEDMYEDVCTGIEQMHASIIILPFHKHHRVDGLMELTLKGYRVNNQRVMQTARCTVGILVDRGIGESTDSGQGGQSTHHVAVLFFGGPDDREALAFASRIAEHPAISLSLIKFVLATPMATSSMRRNEVDGSMRFIPDGEEIEETADENVLSSFNDRYVVPGLVYYVEKQVENGAETVTTLSTMEGTFSLYIVGKGRRGLSPLTMGMSEWEECPELGAIGDLLASSDFTSTGSVLVIQQYTRDESQTLDAESDHFD